jgi:hypothetical protein
MSNSRTICGIAFLTALAICAACSDDGVSPGHFRVTIEVTDPQGDPVAGLELAVVPDTPFYQDGKAAGARAAVTIPFSVAQASDIRLAVEDIEGTEVCLLDETTVPAGLHQRTWIGRDEGGVHQPSGVYAVTLLVRPEGSDVVVLDDRRYMLMALIDPGHLSVGTTDAAGRIVLDDRRLFPHLFDPPDIPATDETGQQVGTIEITSLVRFYLLDPAGGGRMRFDRTVDGSATFDFVWDVEKSAAGEPARRTGGSPVPAQEPPPLENELGMPFPCPFN